VQGHVLCAGKTPVQIRAAPPYFGLGTVSFISMHPIFRLMKLAKYSQMLDYTDVRRWCGGTARGKISTDVCLCAELEGLRIEQAHATQVCNFSGRAHRRRLALTEEGGGGGGASGMDTWGSAMGWK